MLPKKTFLTEILFAEHALLEEIILNEASHNFWYPATKVVFSLSGLLVLMLVRAVFAEEDSIENQDGEKILLLSVRFLPRL